MNPRIQVRNLASPQQWGAAQAGMAWHHIIPFSILREVWNRLVDQHIATDWPETRVALWRYLSLCDRGLSNLDQKVDRIRAVAVRQRASHNPLVPLTVPEATELATAAVWPAWNAVEGPTRRSDDPQNRYFDRFTCGLKPDELARMLAIERLFAQLQSFIAAGGAPGPAALRALGDAASLARGILTCDGPIKYRADMWVEDGVGVWRKRRE